MTDIEISKLLNAKKNILDFSQIDKRHHKGHNFNLKDQEGNQFQVYMRQHKKQTDNFSCGLSFLQKDGSHFTLTRYNGSSHNHRNELENIRLGYVCHIHKATEKYIDKGMKAEGYAESTDRYNNLMDAFICLCEDCNISHSFQKNIFGKYDFK